MLIGLDLIHLNPEFLPTRPPHDCAVYKHGGMLVGKKHAEGHDRSGLDRMCPVDTPPIEERFQATPVPWSASLE